MSAVDDMIAGFCDSMACLRWDIEDYEKWMADYESKRPNYPTWETKDRTLIWIYEIEDSHLDNLIPFIQRKDPENKTNWIDVFRAEKRYRELKAKLPAMKSELQHMEYVSDMCL